MVKKSRILLVEDDTNFGSILKSYLELADYEVMLKMDGKQGLSAFRTYAFELCILDIMMPEMDGFTLAREIRKLNSKIPMIFLTAKTLKEDVLEGFRIGADDYLTKPFDSEVLLYKIAAILKRNAMAAESAEQPQHYEVGKFQFDTRLRTLKLGNLVQSLSPKESELLKMLCTAKEGILTRSDALRQIWGKEDYFTTRSMDVFLARLRKCLKPDPSIEIINIHGNGFRLVIHSD
ncbi:MAG: response regulator transcription factor [Bacteroidetes bacterium]|nr:response regulator transcription factor [Bacteroidota bacterium]